jgi:general secretion pathway protein F
MTAFRYRALNADGKLVKGVQEGDSERQVRASLRSQQLRPVEVSEAAGQISGPKLGNLFQTHVSPAELALVTRQLSTLVQSGLPLDECLQAVAEQTRKAKTKGLLLQVRSRVTEGHALAYAMGDFPQVFSGMYRAMIRAGEAAGFLGAVLEQLADYSEQRQYTQQKLKMAMIYPFILLGVAVAVVVALMVFVVPELVGIFAHTNSELPLLTRILIESSAFLRNYGYWMLLLLVVFVVAIKQLLRNEGRRRVWHQLLLSVPGISGLLTTIDTARFASTLSILMASGVPLLEALRIAGEVLNNRILRESSLDVAERVQEGSSLHRALQQSGRFPPMMVHMVASGERSGELETMLARSATNQERELEMALGTMMGIFEPLMVVFMGGMVLGIVLAILLPIFELNTMVN